jgi:hypothetical protein
MGILQQAALRAYSFPVEQWSKRKFSFITAALAGLWLLFNGAVWRWLSSLKPEAVWPAFFAVVVVPMVLWYLFERRGWDRSSGAGPLRKFGAPLGFIGYIWLAIFIQHREAAAWIWLASLGPLVLWAAVVAMILVILSASWLIANYSWK